MATTTYDESRRPDEEDIASSDFDKALVTNLVKHIFVFPAPEGGYAFVHHGWTLWMNFIELWYKHFVLTENMDDVYFPDYNGTRKIARPIHPEAAEPVFTHLEETTKLPRAAAQLTKIALRCEISPQHGLVNVDNSTFGEIEHFMDSQNSSHPRYSEVSGLKFPICSRDGLTTTLSQGIANNQTLAYFIGRVYLFLKCLGIDENRLQFRQLPPNEMAPGAADCWVVEIKCSSGWVSCAWITHRSAACACKKAVITPNKEELIRAFKDDHKTVRKALKVKHLCI
ncbi:glycine--tRNA ligase, mitochondrial 1-like protein [Tanacetum coccineum]